MNVFLIGSALHTADLLVTLLSVLIEFLGPHTNGRFFQLSVSSAHLKYDMTIASAAHDSLPAKVTRKSEQN